MADEIPQVMRAAVLRGPGDLVVEQRPVPRPDADEVLVAVTAVGVCGSDVHYYEHGRIGGFVVREPLVLGHEAGGVVVAVGDGISKSRVGERVALEPGVPCRRCTPCRQGRYNLCPEIRFFGTPPVDGAFCDYVVLPADFAYAVPDVVSDDAAALLEPLSVGVWANLKAGTTTGTSLLVSGAGPIGLLVAAVASSMGAADVLVSDVDPNRLEMAERYGATQVVDAADPTALDGVEVGAYVDCSGVPAAITAGISTVRPAGSVVLVGMGSDEATLPVSRIQEREITLTGTFRYANTWPAAVELAASGDVDLDGLVTGHVDLDHVEDALAPDPAERHVKLVVRPPHPVETSRRGSTR